MRPILTFALLGSFALGYSAHSATYLGTSGPSEQPPTASGPSAYDDSEAGTRAATARQKPDAPAEKPAAQPTAETPPPAEQPHTGAQGAVDQAAKEATDGAAAPPPSEAQPAAGGSGEQKGAANFDVKNNFRNICSFCHADYGRKAGRGPQLMNSPRSDQFLFDRIKHGLTGRMPGFGSTYSDAQIQQFVKFIRGLKPGQDPQNPA